MSEKARDPHDPELNGEESDKTVEGDFPHAAEQHKDGLEKITYPEGGLRAWAVALGATGVQFSTMGYVNTFG